MEQQNKEYKMYYQCRLCGTRNPINAVLCENPDCRSDLLLYGDQMFDGEEPPVAIDGDIIIEEVQEMTDRAKPAENVQKTRNNEPKRESKINKLDPPMEDPEKKKSKKGLRISLAVVVALVFFVLFSSISGEDDEYLADNESSDMLYDSQNSVEDEKEESSTDILLNDESSQNSTVYEDGNDDDVESSENTESSEIIDSAVIEESEDVEETEEVMIEQEAWVNNILMPNPSINDWDGEGDVFGSEVKRAEIISVSFLDSLQEAPTDRWDVSAAQDGSVQAWVEPNGEKFDLFIAADGGINAAGACEGLFEGYVWLEEVNLNGCFHTDDVTTMHGMFRNTSISNMDLSELNTKNVESMDYMFQGCNYLKSIDMSYLNTENLLTVNGMFNWCEVLTDVDLSGWNTESLENMSGMFYWCESLEKVDLSHFDTSNVKEMDCLFYNCISLEYVDLSNFDTSSVTDMGSMFYWCESLQELDISNFITENVTQMGGMFDGCFSLQKINLGTFETSKVEWYDNFMSGDTLPDGTPWIELFE